MSLKEYKQPMPLFKNEKSNLALEKNSKNQILQLI